MQGCLGVSKLEKPEAMEGVTRGGRHVQYRARRREELERLRKDVKRLQAFYDYMVENDFMQVARFEMLRQQREDNEAWQEAIVLAEEILPGLR